MCISLSLFACALPPKDAISPEVDKSTHVFDASEKIVVRAITQVLKDRGFGQAKEEKVGEDQRRLETEYVPQGDWRTKVEATVKKINPKEQGSDPLGYHGTKRFQIVELEAEENHG